MQGPAQPELREGAGLEMERGRGWLQRWGFGRGLGSELVWDGMGLWAGK